MTDAGDPRSHPHEVIEEALTLSPEERLWLLEQLCLYEVLAWFVGLVGSDVS